MADYRCYFFGPTAQWFGVPRSIEVAKDLRAESDDEARKVAETMYRERPNQTHGFELWQANRLVLRRPGRAVVGSALIENVEPRLHQLLRRQTGS